LQIAPERRSAWIDPFDPVVSELIERDAAERSRIRRAGMVVAIVAHVLAFLITFPEIERLATAASEPPQAYKLDMVQLAPPEPVRQSAPPPPDARRVPVPDPTPDEPEPRFESVESHVHNELSEVPMELVVDVPEGPPRRASIGPVLDVTEGIDPPVRIFAPQPVFPEEARRSGVQGSVILQTIINTNGSVVDIIVLRGLAGGLTEAAVEAVSRWRFEPARRDGTPVAVRYVVRVGFTLQ
jgi:protein TonB